MRFALMVTGPAYGTQQASSAWQFSQALLAAGHELASVFFYREGVYNANQFQDIEVGLIKRPLIQQIELAGFVG